MNMTMNRGKASCAGLELSDNDCNDAMRAMKNQYFLLTPPSFNHTQLNFNGS